MLVLILVLVTGILVLTLIEPKDIVVTRNILIKAPKEVVFDQIVKFRNWPNWSPFYELDTTARYTYSATNGAEGSSYSWESKKEDVGSGSMSNTSVKSTSMDYHIDFLKPFKSTATGALTAKDTAGITKVTWTFTTHTDFPWNAMQAFPFLNIGKMVGKSFEHGLEKMKRFVEANPAAFLADVEIKEADYPAHTYQGVRQLVNWADMKKFFSDIYGTLGKEVGPKISGPAVGLYYTWDTLNKRTDMAAAFPVSDTATSIIGTSFIQVEASKAYITVYKGGYSGEGKAHMALSMHIAKNGKKQGLVIEEYLVGPFQEPDSNKWVTNIYYLVK